ncbi:MAG TPA: CpsB/CapC family capsule biosynthesis tyrosine phosphatase [Gaiellaceae bacterium]|nr:CpsB/CapC family capsule biosynthesis tyrosine phosphatase [Gaiellaceae bacterium]
MIDLHAHILPKVDDGVRSLTEARYLAQQAAAEGIEAITATPHVRSDYPTTAERMEHGVEELRADFAAAGIAVQVLHGGEIALDRLGEIPLDELRRFTLAQSGRYLLLECPYTGSPIALAPAIRALRAAGLTPLIAHPERNPEVQARPARLEALVELGALVQLTAASVDGRLGRSSRTAAFKLVRRGLAHVVASDAHAPEIREGGLAAAVEAFGDEALARYLVTETPQAIVAGEAVHPPPRLRRRRFL